MENYNSYILGSVNSLKNCNTILVYKKSSFVDKISLYNIESFYNTYLKNNTKYVSKLEIEGQGFPYRKTLRGGFDTIVYLDPSTNVPLGYTEFVYVQGTTRNLNIELEIRVGESEIIDISEQPILVIFINNLTNQPLDSKTYTGDKLYNYPTISEAFDKEDYNNNYTTDLEKALNDINSSIVLSESVINKKDGIWKLDINRDIELKANLIGYDRHRVCYYDGDLVVACWKSKIYDSGETTATIKLLSLFTKNQLGYPIVKNIPVVVGSVVVSLNEIYGKYFKGNRIVYSFTAYEETEGTITEYHGKFIVSERSTNTNEVIITVTEYSNPNSDLKVGETYIITGSLPFDIGYELQIRNYSSGQHFSITISEKTLEENLYDIDTLVNIGDPEQYFIDFYSKDNELYRVKEFNKKSDALRYIPDLNNIYLDLNEYLKSQTLLVCGKFGSWYILKQQYKGKNLFLAVSQISCLYFAEEDWDKLIYVNDQTIILKEEKTEVNDAYYIVYSKPGIVYTERARGIVLVDGNYDIDSNIGIWIYKFDDEQENIDHILEYYSDNNKNRLADLVYSTEDLSNTILNSYRRARYPHEIEGIPDIVEAYHGVIFYRDNNKLNYL